MSDGNDLLMGGGIPSAKFAIKGASIRGVVAAPPVTRPQTDMATKEPKRFVNGDVMQQVVIRLQTEERDPAIEGDDGQRATYIKGGSIKRLRETIRKAGAKGLEVGGYFTQTYVSDEMPTGGLPQGAKVYEFSYIPPSGLDTVAPEPVAQSYSAPVAAAAKPVHNPLDNLNEEQRNALAALGFKG